LVMSPGNRSLNSVPPSGGGEKGGSWKGPIGGAGEERNAGDRLESAMKRYKLDASAVEWLYRISPEQALGVLEQIDDSVRSHSAYVTAHARRLKNGTKF